MRSEWPRRSVAHSCRQKELWRFQMADNLALGPKECACSERTDNWRSVENVPERFIDSCLGRLAAFPTPVSERG